MIDEKALDAAAKRSYEYEGDRKGISYVGWDHEPEEVKAEWRESVRQALLPYLCALPDHSVDANKMVPGAMPAGAWR